jgi:hypothetical protein
MVHHKGMHLTVSTAHHHQVADTLHPKGAMVDIAHLLQVTKWDLHTLVALLVLLALILVNIQDMIKVVAILGPIKEPLRADPSHLHNEVSNKVISF